MSLWRAVRCVYQRAGLLLGRRGRGEAAPKTRVGFSRVFRRWCATALHDLQLSSRLTHRTYDHWVGGEHGTKEN
eukprot:6371028-Prymnesium_polylepis.1